jgi:ribose transport system permease protein
MISHQQKRINRNLSIVFVFLLAGLLFILASWLIPGFGRMSNVRNLLIQITILAIIAAGQTFAILSGGIDLSNSWLMTVSAVTTAFWSNGQNEALIWVMPMVVAMGAFVGFINGFGISILKVPPIIMTLAMQVILNGSIVVLVGLAPPPKSPTFIEDLAHGTLLGLPVPLFILLGAMILVTIILTFTSYGRQLYAIGTNETAAMFSGVEPRNVILITYTLSSIFATLSGFVLLGFTGTADLGIGVPYLFPSVVATIVGGASILGGSGHYIGTVAGAILMTILRALLILFNLGAGAISIFYGFTILISVWIASLRIGRKKMLT